jgi:NTE family protein
MKSKIHNYLVPVLLITVVVGYGCARYPVNQLQSTANPEWTEAKKADEITLFLTFSGGGTRAAAFSYGVLEELADRKITINGKETRLLDEVSVISSVSGGSFTAAYYGLFGDRIFTDFESKFLKKNIQGRLISRTFLNPVSWVRLASPGFNMSDLAAEYYDEHIFEKGKIGDMVRRGGPAIVINATDMVSGLRVDFTGEMFDVICSDLWNYPVARAVAASSAVPGILAPVRLRNYASTCNDKRRENIEAVIHAEDDIEDTTNRRAWILRNAIPYLDSGKKKYIHLLDGGIADNLGVRAMMDRIMLRERNLAESIQNSPLENTNKFVFIIVNAETEPDSIWNKTDAIPTIATMLGSYSTIAIQRYNVETLALLKESIKGWSDQIRAARCSTGRAPYDPSCADVQFYVIHVGFNALRDKNEREYFNHIPTSFHLDPEQVDKLRAAARTILGQSKEFERFLKDIGNWAGPLDQEQGTVQASLHISE